MNTLKHIGANLYINNDAVEAIDFLVDHQLMPKTYHKSFAIANQEGFDLDMIVFNPNESDDKFMHFKLEDFASNSETLFYLVNMFNFLSEKDYETYKPAQKKLEDYLYMIFTYRALFGYKTVEED